MRAWNLVVAYEQVAAPAAHEIAVPDVRVHAVRLALVRVIGRRGAGALAPHSAPRATYAAAIVITEASSSLMKRHEPSLRLRNTESSRVHTTPS